MHADGGETLNPALTSSTLVNVLDRIGGQGDCTFRPRRRRLEAAREPDQLGQEQAQRNLTSVSFNVITGNFKSCVVVNNFVIVHDTVFTVPDSLEQLLLRTHGY